MTYKFPHQTLNVALRILGLCLTILILVWALYSSEKYALSLILFFTILIQFWALLNKLTINDKEIINFLNAVRFSDFSQKLGRKGLSAKNQELGSAFDEIMKKFRNDRAITEKENNYFHALIDQIPVALLSIKDNQEASFLNNAAKKLFGLSHISHLSDLESFGSGLQEELLNIRSGKKRLVRITRDNEEIKLALAATKVVMDGSSNHLISLQNIQSELDTTQTEAWQDLVHVLTHELMNSLTPVASLSNSMNSLMKEISKRKEEENISSDFNDMLQDLDNGIEAISRRSRRLDSFVVNYRKMTKVPPPKYQRLEILTLFKNMTQLFKEQCKVKNITLITTATPLSLSLHADPELVDQAMINLIKNAIEIAPETSKDHAGFKITLNAFLDRKGYTIIEISDNGPGIKQKILQRIFVPFYTTKDQGSGIGLSLARQIMLAHHGSIACQNEPGGGATFRLIFKN